MVEGLRPDQERLESGLSLEEMKEAEKNWGMIFDYYDNGPDRVKEILSRLKYFLKSELVDGQKIRESIEQCSKINNREKFIETVFTFTMPIIDLRRDNPEGFEAIQTQAHAERHTSRHIKINKVLSYDKEEGSIHIHLARTNITERNLVVRGLRELAEIVQGDGEVREIVAKSRIVAKNPRILEMLGFTITDDKEGIAVISKEDFDRKYGKNEGR